MQTTFLLLINISYEKIWYTGLFNSTMNIKVCSFVFEVGTAKLLVFCNNTKYFIYFIHLFIFISMPILYYYKACLDTMQYCEKCCRNTFELNFMFIICIPKGHIRLSCLNILMLKVCRMPSQQNRKKTKIHFRWVRKSSSGPWDISYQRFHPKAWRTHYYKMLSCSACKQGEMRTRTLLLLLKFGYQYVCCQHQNKWLKNKQHHFNLLHVISSFFLY